MDDGEWKMDDGEWKMDEGVVWFLSIFS